VSLSKDRLSATSEQPECRDHPILLEACCGRVRSLGSTRLSGVVAQLCVSAYVPDLPGCVATGATVAAVEAEIREAIEFHLEGLKTDGLPVPNPASVVEYVEVAA
jgi:predicted RNase H-like HicB family nuclease